MILADVTIEATGAGSVLGLVVFVSVALGVSFLCSVLEAVLLSTSMSYLEFALQKGSRGAGLMRRLKEQEHIDSSISAILTLNTIAHTVGAAGAGAEAAAIFGSEWIGLIGVVLTLLILVVSEIIPKTIGAVYWKALVSPAAYTITLLVTVLYPIVWACQRLTDLLKPRTVEPTVTRAELEILARVGHKEGTIGARESHVFRNLLRLDRASVTDILTPRTVLFTLPASRTAREVVSSGPISFSRIPISDGDLDRISRFVLRFDVFEATTSGRGEVTLLELSRPLKTVPWTISVARLLDLFVTEQEQIFLVVDEYGGTLGIVTLEDAFESLLGAEITDESDLVTDMREMARRRAARRQRLTP